MTTPTKQRTTNEELAGTGSTRTRPSWDAFSVEYEKRVEPFTMKFAEEIFLEWSEKLERTTPCRKLLDVGCGTGAVTLLGLKNGMDVLATDVSDAMVNRTKVRGVELLGEIMQQSNHLQNHCHHHQCTLLGKSAVANGMDLPSEWSETFDFAIANFSVIFFTDPMKGLQEIYKCLLPSTGKVALSAWGSLEETPAFAIFPKVTAEILATDLAEICKPKRIHGSRKCLEKLLQEAGFVDIKVAPVVKTLQVDSPELYWERFAKTSPPIATLLCKLDVNVCSRLKERILQVATEEGGRPDGGLHWRRQHILHTVGSHRQKTLRARDRLQ